MIDHGIRRNFERLLLRGYCVSDQTSYHKIEQFFTENALTAAVCSWTGVVEFSFFWLPKKLKKLQLQFSFKQPPSTYSPWKTVLFCGKKFGLNRNSRGATASQSCGGSHGLSSSTTGHLALISLVLRYFAVLHLARSILGLSYSYDLATLRNF